MVSFNICKQSFDVLRQQGWLNNLFIIESPNKTAYFSAKEENNHPRMTNELNRLSRLLNLDSFFINTVESSSRRKIIFKTQTHEYKHYSKTVNSPGSPNPRFKATARVPPKSLGTEGYIRKTSINNFQ